jgi:hypothetical protein
MNAGVQDVAGLVLYLMTTAITKKSKKHYVDFHSLGKFSYAPPLLLRKMLNATIQPTKILNGLEMDE